MLEILDHFVNNLAFVENDIRTVILSLITIFIILLGGQFILKILLGNIRNSGFGYRDEDEFEEIEDRDRY